MNIKRITKLFCLILVAVIAIYDVYAISSGGTEASISSLIIVSCYKFPALPFFMGYICGHLTWRMRSNKDTAEIDEK